MNHKISSLVLSNVLTEGCSQEIPWRISESLTRYLAMVPLSLSRFLEISWFHIDLDSEYIISKFFLRGCTTKPITSNTNNMNAWVYILLFIGCTSFSWRTTCVRFLLLISAYNLMHQEDLTSISASFSREK